MVVMVVPVDGNAQADIEISSAFIGVVAESVEVIAVGGIEEVITTRQQFEIVAAGESGLPAHVRPQQGVGARGWKEIFQLPCKGCPEYMAGFKGKMQFADTALKHQAHFRRGL